MTIVCDSCGFTNEVPAQYCAKCKAPFRMKGVSDNLIRMTLDEYRSLREENITSTRLNYVIIGAVGTLQVGLVTIATKVFGADILASTAIFIVTSMLGLLGLLLWAAESTRRMRTALYIRDVINPRLRLFLGWSVLNWEEETEPVLKQLVSYPLAWEEFLRNETVVKHYKESRRGKVGDIFAIHYTFFFIGSVLIITLVGFGPLVYGLLSSWLTVFRLIGPEAALTLPPQLFFLDPSLTMAEVKFFRVLLLFTIVWSSLCFLKPGWVKKVWQVIQTERTL